MIFIFIGVTTHTVLHQTVISNLLLAFTNLLYGTVVIAHSTWFSVLLFSSSQNF